jgi:hypothetical protein
LASEPFEHVEEVGETLATGLQEGVEGEVEASLRGDGGERVQPRAQLLGLLLGPHLGQQRRVGLVVLQAHTA